MPPARWLEQFASRSVRNLYLVDRNFDRIVAGSSTKPIIAGAALIVHPIIFNSFRVQGGYELNETDIFGIIVQPKWRMSASRSLNYDNWCDFASYLAVSDNRYQIRLGFLALAERTGGSVARAAPRASAMEESLDGGRNPWRWYPRFPAGIAFSHRNSGEIESLDRTPFAEKLRDMFSISVRHGERDYRTSFWTGEEASDVRPDKGNRNRAFDVISPQAPDFELDKITTPREYVSLLFGGGTNLWSNVDLAAAFTTAVRGQPVLPHIVKGKKTVPLPSRIRFQEIAARLRQGLQHTALTRGGTAYASLNETNALPWLRSLPRTRVYAKTGTLSVDDWTIATSRIVMALMNYNRSGNPEKGIVLSLFVEEADAGVASRWIGEFLVENRGWLETMLR